MFSLGRIRFRLKAVSFGLNLAPRIFTKLANAAVKILRLQRIQMVAYLGIDSFGQFQEALL